MLLGLSVLRLFMHGTRVREEVSPPQKKHSLDFMQQHSLSHPAHSCRTTVYRACFNAPQTYHKFKIQMGWPPRTTPGTDCSWNSPNVAASTLCGSQGMAMSAGVGGWSLRIRGGQSLELELIDFLCGGLFAADRLSVEPTRLAG